jgi:hypothetical protein
MKTMQRGYTTAIVLVYVTVLLVGGIGWVWNIVKLVQTDFASLTGMIVARCFGIVIPPLGAVLGYL